VFWSKKPSDRVRLKKISGINYLNGSYRNIGADSRGIAPNSGDMRKNASALSGPIGKTEKNGQNDP